MRDILNYLIRRKKWWLIPSIVLILAGGILFALGNSAAIVTSIYTLF